MLRDSALAVQSDASTVLQYVRAYVPESCPSKRLARRLAVNRRIIDWFAQALSRFRMPPGPAIELGCGPGAYLDVWRRPRERFVTGADIREPFVRHVAQNHPHAAALLCDALDPPFRAHSFALVAAINLLDATPEPWVLLGQMDALLMPGGICAIALPYSANFAGPADLFAALAGNGPQLQYLSYSILDSKDWLPWVLPASERHVHEYSVHALIARKESLMKPAGGCDQT